MEPSLRSRVAGRVSLPVFALAASLLLLAISGASSAQESGQAKPPPQPSPGPAPAQVEGTGVKAAPASGSPARAYRLVPPPAKFSPPVLTLDNANYDWGTALQGEVVEHAFKITNSGGAPLVIDRVKPSCGCTAVSKPDKPILPGESDVVTLQINTKSLTDKPKKSADIYSNDASSPTKIFMGGTVEPLFEVEPKLPKLDMVMGLPTEPLKITLRRQGTKPLKVSEVKTKTEILTSKINEVEAGTVYEIECTAKLDESDRKYYYEQLDVVVQAEEKTLDIPIRVSVTVKDRIDVQPRNSVYFNRNETKALSAGGEPVVKTLDIMSLGGPGHTFKITEVTNEGKTFGTKIDTVEEGKHYRLALSLAALPASDVRRTVNEKITLKTDDPTVPEIKVTALAAIK